jgi:hypothetical protein
MALLDLINVPAGSERPARMYLIPLDPDSGEEIDGFDAMRLQYWPDTIAWDRGQIGWQSRQIPGLSHPLYSWVANGSPTVSFEMVFTADTDPAFMPTEDAEFAFPAERNVNINAAAAWLAGCTNPLYLEAGAGGDDAQRSLQPPPIIQLVCEYAPPSAVGESLADELLALSGSPPGAGGATETSRLASRRRGLTLSQHAQKDFYGVVTSLNINYIKSFVSGAPRIMRATLSLAEVIQLGDLVLPHSRAHNLQVAREYNLLEKLAAA